MTAIYEDVHMSDVFEPNYGRGDEARKLFLGGLSWDTNEQDLFSYFSKFGQVDNVNIKYDSVTGKPRGFGFITFANDSPIELVLQGGPHVIRNKNVDPKRPRSKPAFKKIFVGGIDADMPEEEIRSYFGRFGNVEGIECPFDRQKGKRREFCFIIFDTEEAASAAVNEPKQLIGNKECDIKKAQPQRQQNQTRNGNGTFNGATGNGNGYFGGAPRGRSAGSGWNTGGYQQDVDPSSLYRNGATQQYAGGSSYTRKTYTNSNFYPFY